MSHAVPAFPLNEFPSYLPYKIAEELVYIMATRGNCDVQGREWEKMFADAIQAKWSYHPAGLDDIILGNTAWGAKSVKQLKPSKVKTVRLISGRNDLQYAYDGHIIKPLETDPDETGALVLDIYNSKVSKVRETHEQLRTLVFVRSPDLSEVVIFEYNTILYDPELFYWKWNKQRNLEGYFKRDNKHKFTWQSGGTQFTIIEDIPTKNVHIKVKAPDVVDKTNFLSKIGFDKSWVTITKNK
ncbi:MAG: hypothetical protein K0S09_2755 [Sphingobacteriaceae bacterium]|jgi:hypothetical protein|nr:hypothetical protein [Sphingobacteriaceae bacterium]